jgi:hypothetical protein
MKIAALGLGVAALLSACGGGEEPILNLSLSAGMWNGTTSDSQREVNAVTLRDGKYFAVYSAAGGGATIGGGVQGTATVVDGQFISTDMLSFSVEGQAPVNGTFTAGIDPFTSIAGTAIVPNQPPVTFQARCDTGEAGFALGIRPATFNISAAGEVTSTINGCPITGTVTPRTDGNAYDMSVVFGGAPCVLANLRFDGIVFLREGGKHLYSVSRNNAARQTIVFSGVKP